MKTSRQEVIDLMRSSKSEKEWDANCDIVKASHDGGYPEYWFAEIVLSGLAAQVSKGWSR